MTIGTIIIIILLMMLTSFSTYILTRCALTGTSLADKAATTFDYIVLITLGIDIVIICLLIMKSIFWLILNWNLPI